MQNIKTYSGEETKSFAKSLAEKMIEDTNGPLVIALSGDLGAGKTTFVQGFAQGLGIQEKIISPTFILIREHPVPRANKTLYHIDLYRLEDTSQLSSLGLNELFDNPDNIVLIEWAEKAEHLTPKDTIKISISKISEKGREINITYPKIS